ncbi:outer membrane protein assembly factor BamB family protein [Flavitalea sp.]|nr:PQQ-binding-like beta-propeller repeat protein [Flavitalea sp.]
MEKTIAFLFSLIIFVCSCKPDKKFNTWTQYKGSDENIHYSSLAQIDTNNVKSLKPAWEYHTGDADTANASQIQCNPIIVDGILYGTSPQMKLFAIEAGTGKEKWKFNPFDTLEGDKRGFFIHNNSRGVTYWNDGDEDKRIYYTAGSYMYCINAMTGQIVKSFGDSGRIDLHNGLGRDVKTLFVTATSPGIVYKDLLIMGTRVHEGSEAAPGHIRAYDLRTGKQKWMFHTIPEPGEKGHESWEDRDAYKAIGGANAWGGLSLDSKRGIVFAGTGSANYDFYGGMRKGNNLFANSVLALNAATGKYIWHFQYIHHDVWDRDLPAPPVLVTISKEDKKVDAVAVTTKTGNVFVFERENGKPVYDIIEKPVPTNSDLIGEQLSPTQPYPVKPLPFMRQVITENDLNHLLPDSSYEDVKKRWAALRNDHMFNPPSLQGTLEFPGLDGGAEWGGPSYDPQTGILYINANEVAWVVKAVENKKSNAVNETVGQAGKRLYQINCMVCHGANRQGSANFPGLDHIQAKYTAGAFDTLLMTGRRMMPGFGQLNVAQRNAIASFILDIKTNGKKLFKDSSSKKNDHYFNLPYTMSGISKFVSKEGYPAIAPPWGTLNAIDLNTGDYVWKRPLGQEPGFPFAQEQTGSESYGASVITAGGLIFIAATKDGMFRAFNKTNGKLLWESKLPAPAYATPSIYEVDGRQYVVIACGGGKMKTRSGDSYVAFALPR